ncbi:MAG: holo-ACP synthase [Porticoccaceae bacterium]|nr:holo-ACP synthase [Porticoccaceae bacterium]
MILGIGTDMVRISRIESSIAKNADALAKRVLTPAEFEIFTSSAAPAAYLAKRFAVKEAASKAFGTGIGKISWQELEVVNNEAGAPVLHCFGQAKIMLAAMGAGRIDVSIADEADLALAFVVISRSS